MAPQIGDYVTAILQGSIECRQGVLIEKNAVFAKVRGTDQDYYCWTAGMIVVEDASLFGDMRAWVLGVRAGIRAQEGA